MLNLLWPLFKATNINYFQTINRNSRLKWPNTYVLFDFKVPECCICEVPSTMLEIHGSLKSLVQSPYIQTVCAYPKKQTPLRYE